jgi:phytoene synthase
MYPAFEECRAETARLDPDRYRVSLFAPRALQRGLWALLAFNAEIAHIGAAVREPLLGMIRLTWWRDGLEEIYAGRVPRDHFVLQTLASVMEAHALPRDAFLNLLTAREADLEAAPFPDRAALYCYLHGSSGSLIRLFFALAGEEEPLLADAIGEIWGIVGLLRARPFWRARGRDWMPHDEGEAVIPSLTAQVRARMNEIKRRAYRGPSRYILLYPYWAGLYLQRLERHKFAARDYSSAGDIWRLALAYPRLFL